MDRITALQGSLHVHLEVKPVVASQNVGCFPRLISQDWVVAVRFVCFLPPPPPHRAYLKNKTSQDLRQSLGFVIILHPFSRSCVKKCFKIQTVATATKLSETLK